MMEVNSHPCDAPANDHTDQNNKRNKAQFDQPDIGEGTSVLSGQIAKVDRELLEPINA